MEKRLHMRRLTVVLLICSVLVHTPIFGFEGSAAWKTESGDRTSAAISDPPTIDRISRQVSVVAFQNTKADKAVLHFSTTNNLQDRPEKGWIARHPVLFGTIVGFGAGFAVGYATGNDAARGDPSSDYLTPEEKGLLFGGIGAGIGALVGKLFFHNSGG